MSSASPQQNDATCIMSLSPLPTGKKKKKEGGKKQVARGRKNSKQLELMPSQPLQL